MESFVWAATVLAVTGMLSLAGLRAWRGWIDLRRFEIAQQQEARRDSLEPVPARIEMADLKERLRKLEALAAGLEL